MSTEDNKRKLKIAFFGTSDRSIPILESLKNSFELSLCVTKEDVKVGRKQIVKSSGVKAWAVRNNVPIRKLTAVRKGRWSGVISLLKEYKITYGVVADFSFIIPKSVIDYFQGKLINIHFSLLPKYRGASPVQFAILNGDKKTGVTYQLVHEKLDQGNIVEQIEYILPQGETAGKVYTKMFDLAANNIAKVVYEHAQDVTIPTPQNEDEVTWTWSKTHPKRTTIYKEDAEIDWQEDSNHIYNAIRAYNPWPIAWTTLGKLESGMQNMGQQARLKENVSKENAIKVYSAKIGAKGTLELDEVQVAGKRRMGWKDFSNGYLK
jgi:methionyl-tRNA formyltransferase